MWHVRMLNAQQWQQQPSDVLHNRTGRLVRPPGTNKFGTNTRVPKIPMTLKFV